MQGTLDALQHVESVDKVQPGSWGAAGTLQGARGVGGAGLAAFPDREPQLLTLATQHQVSLVVTAADLPGGEEPGSRRGGPPMPTPTAALQGVGQVDRG